MRSDPHSSLVEMLLLDLAHDCVCAFWLDGIARRLVVDVADRTTVSIGIVGWALLDGKIEAGSVDGPDFTPFEGTPAAVLSRVVGDWLALERLPPRLNDVCWFKATVDGAEVAARVGQAIERANGFIDEVSGGGSLTEAKAVMSQPSYSFDKVWEMVDAAGLSNQDRDAMAFGLLLQTVIVDRARVEGGADDVSAAVDEIFRSLRSGNYVMTLSADM